MFKNIKTVKANEVCNANALTHSGLFHADEVFASVMLAQFMPVRLCRTVSVPEFFDGIVFDIGGGELDHHQRGGNGARKNGIPYAACGLVWIKYGAEVLRAMGCEESLLDIVWKIVDKNLVQPIDAVDNGVDNKNETFMPVSVSRIISGFNPVWNSTESADAAFLRACEMAETILNNEVKAAIACAEANDLTHQAIEEAKDQIMIMDRYFPFLSSGEIFDTDIVYAIFPGLRGGYNVRCIPVKQGSKELRHSLPEAWRGLPAEQLRSVSSVLDATFVHPAGFIGGAETLEGAIAMAKAALK